MALALDASTPVMATNGGSAPAALTTASFTAPPNALLVAFIAYDGSGANNQTVTDSGGLTWTRRGRKNPDAATSTGGAGVSGGCEIWSATTLAGSPVTVSAHIGVTAGASNLAPSITVPSGASVGDIFLVNLALNNTDVITSEPANLNTIGTNIAVSGGAQFASRLYWGLIDGTNISPGSVLTWATSVQRTWTIVLEAYSGVDKVSPIHASGQIQSTNAHVSPSITTTVSSYVVEIASFKPSSSTLISSMDPGTGWTARQSFFPTGTFSPTSEIADNSSNPVAAGSYGGNTWTLNTGSNPEALYTIALLPATVGVSRTVTTTGSSNLARSLSVKVFTDTNAPTAGAIAATSATSGLPSASVITTAANSWVWAIIDDWNQNGLGTAGTGQTLVDEYNPAGLITTHLVKQNSATATSGTSVTCNLTAPASEQYDMLIFEIKAGPGGGGTPVTVNPVAISSAEAWGNPSLSATVNLSPIGIPSSEAFGSPTISGATVISPSGIATAEAFGNPTITAVATVSPVGIASSEAFGNPVISGATTVSPTGIASNEAFGNPALSYSTPIVAVGIPSSEAWGNPTIHSVLTVSPVGIPSAEAFGLPRISGAVVPIPANLDLDSSRRIYYQGVVGDTTLSTDDLYYKFLQIKTTQTNMSTEDMEKIYWCGLAGLPTASVEDAKNHMFNPYQSEELYYLRAQP